MSDGKITRNEFHSSVNTELDEIAKKMNKEIVDDTTAKKYEIGIKDGLLYYREVI